jgi:hypothetical protein
VSPWHVAKGQGCPASKPWAVILDSDGSKVGCHETKAEADKQVAALYASEGGRAMAKFKVVENAPGCPEGKTWGVVGEDGKRLSGCGCHDTEAQAKVHMAAYFAGQASAPRTVEIRAAERHLAAVWLGEEQPGMLGR